ncbi:uncharacterized protein GVI51_B01661 [Nakaseomyces glabratus]|nr:Ribosomal protein L34 [Nakaseomyces glabratus]KAH7591605.1 Ribosomal protein L34 [Nakaseomyces glabratus]KAH7598200.1 Ribosomal protein L34 [Nakaseomyces glabratus]KAH7608830.1 Ribosomal protein L34 [Nakaseomyces glabratus]KAH7609078.1 Ribosomal protein L34 [Nakaseomyces glabratus]
MFKFGIGLFRNAPVTLKLNIQNRPISMLSSSFGVLRPMNLTPGNGMIGKNSVSLIRNEISSGTSFSSILTLFPLQRRWKSRGNTYQPSTLKRKRKFGFLARMTNKRTAKIIKRRKEKGRWYLTH